MKYNNETQMWESKYWHPALTTDAVVFGFDKDEASLNILLIRRGKAKVGEIPAYENYWALPGGFIKQEEPTDECVLRELKEETWLKPLNDEKGINPVFIEQLHTFSKRGRDPREFVVTVAYYALIKMNQYVIKGGDDAAEAKWFHIDELPENLAFDHAEIISMAIGRLREKVHFCPICYDLVSENFTLSELKGVYDVILGIEHDRGNFRKKILSLDYVLPTGKKDNGHPHRSGVLYCIDRDKYHTLEFKDRF